MIAQELITYLIVIISAIYALRKFVIQFNSNNLPGCSGCSCAPTVNKSSKLPVYSSAINNGTNVSSVLIAKNPLNQIKKKTP